MKAGILGSGIVARTLGAGFIKHGHSVMLGTRDASKLADWVKQSGGRVGSFDETAAFGELVVLAVKGSVAEGLVKGVGKALAGKVVMDTTNPIAENTPPENGVIRFFTSLEGSLLERLQAAQPDAKFVKAFNSVGSARMVSPS